MIVWNQKEAGIKPAEKRKWYTLKYRRAIRKDGDSGWYSAIGAELGCPRNITAVVETT